VRTAARTAGAPLLAFDRWWYAAMPPERLAALRMAVGGFAVAYLLVRAPALLAVAHFPAAGFDPVGPVLVLSSPLPVWLSHASFAATVVAGLAFTAGVRYRVTGPLFALLLLWFTSYRSSFGMKFHSENLLVFHALLLAAAPAAHTWSWDARHRTGDPPEAHGRYGWAIRAMCLVTVITYVLAGVAKVRNTGWEWAGGDVLRLHIAYDNLRKIELGSVHSPLGAALVEHGWLFPPLAAASMAIELGAPVALLGRRVAAVWSALAWSFHVGVLALMAIAFPYPLSGVAFLPFLRAERLWRRGRRLVRTSRPDELRV
jgi:hypothetical protein